MNTILTENQAPLNHDSTEYKALQNTSDKDLELMHFNAIEQQIRPWHVSHPQLIDLLRKYPRHLFLAGQIDGAYVDHNLKLEYPKLFDALGLKFDSANQPANNRPSYILAPKLEARLLQVIVEHLEIRMKDLYKEAQKSNHSKHFNSTKQTEQIEQSQPINQPTHTIKLVMLGADSGYIPHILNTLIQSQYYHDALEMDKSFIVDLKITIIEANTHLLTLLSANLQKHHATHLASFKIMQNNSMHQIPMNDDLQQTDLIFATASSPYLLPIYDQVLAENGYGIAFVGERLLQSCDVYQKITHADTQVSHLIKEKTLFETWLPAFDVPAPKVFVF
jgi:hypothetical protein